MQALWKQRLEKPEVCFVIDSVAGLAFGLPNRLFRTLTKGHWSLCDCNFALSVYFQDANRALQVYWRKLPVNPMLFQAAFSIIIS